MFFKRRNLVLFWSFFLMGNLAYSIDNPETKKLNEFFETIFQESLQRSPQFETYVGGKKNYSKLNDISDDFEREELAILKRQLKELEKFNYDKLDDQGKISFDVFKSNAKRTIDAEEFFYHDYPVNQMFGIQSSLPSFMINMHQISSRSDAYAYISRLKGFETVVSQLIKKLETRKKKGVIVPQFALPKVIADSKNIITGVPFNQSEIKSPLYEDFENKVNKLKDISNSQKRKLVREAARILKKSVQPAYEKLIAYVENLKKVAPEEGSVALLPNGREYYKSALRYHTTTDMSPQKVHYIGISEVKRIHEEMVKISKRLGFEGSLKKLFEHVQTSPKLKYEDSEKGRQAYLADARNIISKMEAKLPKMFGIFPKAKLEVKPVEKYREKSAGLAFYEPPSGDGSRPGRYYVNYDMNAVLKYEMEALAYHEAIPGHHMQNAIAIELENIPNFRKHLWFTAYGEGWGLYAESIPKEFGFYKDIYSDFGRLSMELWRACRLVVDTGIHYYKWTKKQAVSYLSRNTPSQEVDNIKAVERYMVMPGQATAYKIGMLKILELRTEAESKLERHFKLQDFHDEVLRYGGLPLDVLESRVNLWIDKELQRIKPKKTAALD